MGTGWVQTSSYTLLLRNTLLGIGASWPLFFLSLVGVHSAPTQSNPEFRCDRSTAGYPIYVVRSFAHALQHRAQCHREATQIGKSICIPFDDGFAEIAHRSHLSECTLWAGFDRVLRDQSAGGVFSTLSSGDTPRLDFFLNFYDIDVHLLANVFNTIE